ncbi:heme NO-binding domain-containing protein [Paracoccus sp. TOH]|uniref:heme NO-binding domain-containing protein n=1 Tax=Paracoccus sp. TOH TaxID=1263728 RepID=UPI000217546B|nr:heme NO-binding domain-containing protein [Paracoccus sp. TOH]WJS85755.1 heme NO-binding domain-containing protein [Paracoccus sp. TOH]
MHGLVNRSVEAFTRATYGDDLWTRVLLRTKADPNIFLTWNETPNRVTYSLVIAAAMLVGKSRNEYLEDIGSWLTRQEQIRRLLRFSGESYGDFLESLQDLPNRIRLVIPELLIPDLRVAIDHADCYRISASDHQPGFLSIIAGVLRGMADDYGALAIILASNAGIAARVAQSEYSMKRHFSLYRRREAFR